MTLPHLELWLLESLLALLIWPVLSPRFKDRFRSSAATLPLLLGRGLLRLSPRCAVEKCGIVVSGITVVVVAALLFLLMKSLPEIGRFEGRIDAASETRRS